MAGPSSRPTCATKMKTSSGQPCQKSSIPRAAPPVSPRPPAPEPATGVRGITVHAARRGAGAPPAADTPVRTEEALRLLEGWRRRVRNALSGASDGGLTRADAKEIPESAGEKVEAEKSASHHRGKELRLPPDWAVRVLQPFGTGSRSRRSRRRTTASGCQGDREARLGFEHDSQVE